MCNEGKFFHVNGVSNTCSSSYFNVTLNPTTVQAAVRVLNSHTGIVWLWSRAKFLNRRFGCIASTLVDGRDTTGVVYFFLESFLYNDLTNKKNDTKRKGKIIVERNEYV